MRSWLKIIFLICITWQRTTAFCANENQLPTYYITKAFNCLGYKMTSYSTLYYIICFLFFLYKYWSHKRDWTFFQKILISCFRQKQFYNNYYLFDNAASTSLFKHLKPSMHFSSPFCLHAWNWLNGVIIRLVRLTQMFATEDHNIKMFSKITTFLQNQFTKNWFVTSLLNYISIFFNKLKVISERFR